MAVEWPLIFLAGVLGSSHCVGMCGGFALTIGGPASLRRTNLARQLFYSAGRIFTYAALGAVAGYCGLRLTRFSESLVNASAGLAALAGLLLIVQGLLATGILRRRWSISGRPACLASGLYAHWLTSPARANVFMAGVFTGLLPCGLLYGMLALAAAAQSAPLGMARMTLFGLGTVPVMVLTGLSTSFLGLQQRQRLYQIAAWSLVLTGSITIARGMGHLQVGGWQGHGCPACRLSQ